ncbi:MAG: CHAD domain-containing protein, partial [Chloroflexaceae bacterium]|nr:CHAD domain-containing protein [Chloroflexaceae bacterium]
MTQTESLPALDTLIETYLVDKAHARHVADAALVLFDATAETHGLNGAARRLLELGALLHNVGLHSNPEQHHLAGRDIVLSQSLPDVDDNERALIACMVAFHRKKVRPKVEPAFLSLGKRNQETALWLAALVRVADGLDYSESQTTGLVGVEPTEHGLALHLSGPHAASDGARAVAKADLWHKVSGQELHCVVVDAPAVTDGASEETQSETTAERAAEIEEAQPSPEVAHSNGTATLVSPAVPAMTSVASTTLLADYGRQLLRRYFRRMLSEERGVQADKGPEAVHQLRVASRRLRATTGLLAEVAPAKPLRRFSKTIKQIANEAAGVRDADVFLAQVASYAEGLADDQREQVQPLVEALQRDRAAARDRLL